MMRVPRPGAFAIALASLLFGCHSSTPAVQPQTSAPAAAADDTPAPAQEVTFFAAASTQDALEAVLQGFQRLHPSVKVSSSFAASSTLAEQIASGAQADLFLSASRHWADYLQQESLVAKKHDLLMNDLVAVVPNDAKWQVRQPDDLLKDEIEHIAIGEPDSVPAGVYARQALTRLELWERLQDKLVSGNDVRHALATVETGAAEVGIVYSTDAIVSGKVKVAFPFDRDLTDPIVYPLVLTKRGGETPAARKLYEFLQSPNAAAVFRQSGFRVQQKGGVQ